MSTTPEWLKPYVNKFVLAHTFLSQIYFAKDNVEDNEVEFIAYTEPTKRGYNKELFTALTIKQGVGVIAHEVLHDVLDHHKRIGGRHPMLWNIAADLEVNRILMKEINLTNKRFELPPDCCYDPKYDETWTAERIYDDLLKQTKGKIECMSIPGTGADIKHTGKDGKKFSESEINSGSQKVKAAVASASNLMKTFGEVSGELQRCIQSLLYPKQKWYEVLQDYFTNLAWDEYDWTKISNRDLAKSGLIMPKMYSEEIEKVMIAIDCSGSINQEQLDEFQGHINNILMECPPKETVIVYFDTHVLGEETYSKYEYPISLVPKGGGGTDFTWLKAYNDIGINACVFLTDGYGRFPEEWTVTYPVIWCLNHNQEIKVPFGTSLVLEN